jgi:valyl-tRNA synthetase
MEALVQDISVIRTTRNDNNIAPNVRISVNLQDQDAAAISRMTANNAHYDRLARVNLPEDKIVGISFSGQNMTTTSAVSAGVTFIIPIADPAAEKERLRKEITKLDGELARFAAKLGNPGFLAKAKPEIIEEQREREADAHRDRDRLQTAYDRLEAV